MKLLAKALILLTCCSVLPACKTVATVPLRPDQTNPERFVCAAAARGDRPALPPAHTIDWGAVTTVQQARGEHDAYVRSMLDRNGAVAAYVVGLEEKLFVCANNAQWLREYYAGLPH